jgi:uroporphyrinogen-III decarboxylase
MDLEFIEVTENDCIPKDIDDSKSADIVLKTIELLSTEGKTVVGCSSSPFRIASKLKNVNEKILGYLKKICKKWINAQIREGADYVIFYDIPLSRDEYIASMDVYSHIASKRVWYSGSRVLDKIDLIENSGFGMATVSSGEKISRVRKRSKSDITLAGNLNAEKMSEWDQSMARKNVIKCVKDGMRAGNFVLSADGEVPYYTGLATLRTIVATAREFSSRI